MNELKSNIKYETTTLSGDTHYYQPDTFTVMPINIGYKSQEDLAQEIVRLNTRLFVAEQELQAYKDKENKLRELVKDYKEEEEEYIQIDYVEEILNEGDK